MLRVPSCALLLRCAGLTPGSARAVGMCSQWVLLSHGMRAGGGSLVPAAALPSAAKSCPGEDGARNADSCSSEEKDVGIAEGMLLQSLRYAGLQVKGRGWRDCARVSYQLAAEGPVRPHSPPELSLCLVPLPDCGQLVAALPLRSSVPAEAKRGFPLRTCPSSLPAVGPRPLLSWVRQARVAAGKGCDALRLACLVPFLVAVGAGPCGVTARKSDNQLIAGRLAWHLCGDQIQYLCKSC